VCPRKHVLDEGVHWRNLVNTTEPSVCGGNAAFLSNYVDHMLLVVPALCVDTVVYCSCFLAVFCINILLYKYIYKLTGAI